MSIKVQLNSIRKKSTWAGKEPENHSPALNYCRKLIKEGFDPKERLDIYRGEELTYSVISLEEGAKRKVRENNKIGPIFVKYKEIDEKTLAALRLKGRKKTSPSTQGAI